MIFIGIDPGITGAIAVIEREEVLFWDAPVTEVEGAKKTHRMLDPHSAAQILRGFAVPQVSVWIEQVNAMPGLGPGGKRVSIGATSAFNFGQGYGMWLGILAALRFSYVLVRPQVWKKRMLPGVSGPDKDAGRIRARQMFPQAVESLDRKKDHGRADALLIAAYGRAVTEGKAK